MDNYNKPSSTFKDRKKDTDKKLDLTISTVFNKEGKDNNFQENKRNIENTEPKKPNEQTEYRISDVPKPPPPLVLPLSRQRQEPILSDHIFSKSPQPKPPNVQATKEPQPLATPPRPTVRPPATTTRPQAKNNSDIKISSDLLKGAVITLLLVLFVLITTRLIGC